MNKKVVNNKKKINICITSDDNYAEHMYITIFSTLYNLNKDYRGIIWIFDSGLNDKNKLLLKSLEKQFKNSEINFVHVNEEKYRRLPDFYGTYQTYFRIDAPNLLKNLDKVLYLDPDIVVDGDISEVYNIDLAEYYIGAPTSGFTFSEYEKKLHIPVHKYGWFCAGVMLMNLRIMRENHVDIKIFKYIRDNIDKISSDQEAINAILYNKRKEIHIKYQVDHYIYTRYYKIFKTTKDSPVIIHFGGWKPWKKYCPNQLSYKYNIYRELSGLKPCQFSANFEFVLWLKKIRCIVMVYFICIYQGLCDYLEGHRF